VARSLAQIARISQIALDMDGVLVDCVRGCMRLYGVEPPAGDRYDDITEWDGISAAVAQRSGRPLDEAEMWGRVGQQPESWWAVLEPTPWADALVREVCALVGIENVSIVTCPLGVGYAASAAGKLQWVRRHFPTLERAVILAKRKGLVAAPGRLLIDDGDHNIIDWAATGAPTMTWPAPWNELRHRTASHALGALRALQFGVAT
jgi:5'(3')-deoxyribonucleotidase